MFSVISDAMPGGLEQEELSKKVKEAAMSRLYDVKRDSKDRKIIHEYGVKWFVTASREVATHSALPKMLQSRQ